MGLATYAVDFGPRRTGLAGTVGYRHRLGTRTTTGITERESGTGIYEVTIDEIDPPSWILWDTGGVSPKYAAEDLNAPWTQDQRKLVNFGPRHAGLSTVGYRLGSGSRTTTGVAQILAGTGIYAVLITDATPDRITALSWDTGEATPIYAADTVDLSGLLDVDVTLFETALVARLKTIPEIQSLAGRRVLPGVIPQRGSFPCVTYEVLSKFDNSVIAGAGTVKRARVAIASWALDYSIAKRLSHAVSLGIPVGFRGDLYTGGPEVTGTTQSEESDHTFAPDDGSDRWTHQVIFELLLNYRETG